MSKLSPTFRQEISDLLYFARHAHRLGLHYARRYHVRQYLDLRRVRAEINQHLAAR